MNPEHLNVFQLINILHKWCHSGKVTASKWEYLEQHLENIQPTLEHNLQSTRNNCVWLMFNGARHNIHQMLLVLISCESLCHLSSITRDSYEHVKSFHNDVHIFLSFIFSTEMKVTAGFTFKITFFDFQFYLLYFIWLWQKHARVHVRVVAPQTEEGCRPTRLSRNCAGDDQKSREGLQQHAARVRWSGPVRSARRTTGSTQPKKLENKHDFIYKEPTCCLSYQLPGCILDNSLTVSHIVSSAGLNAPDQSGKHLDDVTNNNVSGWFTTNRKKQGK